MKASLEIEAIGHNTVQQVKLWCGIGRDTGFPMQQVIGRPSHFQRWGVWDADTGREVYGRTDYSKANSKGSRGVRIWYTLESGRRYRVRAPQSWKSSDEYICHVTEDGNIVRE